MAATSSFINKNRLVLVGLFVCLVFVSAAPTSAANRKLYGSYPGHESSDDTVGKIISGDAGLTADDIIAHGHGELDNNGNIKDYGYVYVPGVLDAHGVLIVDENGVRGHGHLNALGTDVISGHVEIRN